MDTTTAQNYLENTKMTFKLKAGAAILMAAAFGFVVLAETIVGHGLSHIEDIYLILGIAALLVTGGAVKTLKAAKGAFVWGYLLTPFILADIVIALSAGLIVLAICVFFPCIPIALAAWDIYKKRAEAKLYL